MVIKEILKFKPDSSCSKIQAYPSCSYELISRMNDKAFLLKDENLKLIAKTQAKVICEFFGIAFVEQVNNQLNKDVDVLVGAKIIDSPDYWKNEKEYKTEYVQALIHKIAKYIRKHRENR